MNLYITCLQTHIHNGEERFTKGKQYKVVELLNNHIPVVVDNFGKTKTVHLDKGEYL